MKSLKSLAILVFTLTIASDLAFAGLDNSRVGTRVFNFLKIETAARPIAMGGAFTGVADDASALFYNPAGVASLGGRNIIAGYHDNIFDMQSGFLGYIHPVGIDRKFSIYVSYLNYGDFIGTDDYGTETGTFSGSDMLFAAGYSMAAKKNLHFGAVGKFIYEKIDKYSSTGLAVDLAAKIFLNNKLTSLGLTVQNLGGQLSGYQDNSEKEPLPMTFRAGISSRLRGLPMLVAADFVAPTDNDIYFCLGAEFLDLKPLFLRAGWSSFGSNYKTDSDKDDFAGFTAGFGLTQGRLHIAYAISPQAELGTGHRVTLTGGF
jgi:hypothetical protein